MSEPRRERQTVMSQPRPLEPSRAFADESWSQLLDDCLTPWRRVVAVADAVASPFLDRLVVPLKVPRWLNDDLLCEAAGMIGDLAGLPKGVPPITLAVNGVAPTNSGVVDFTHGRTARHVPNRQCGAADGIAAAVTTGPPRTPPTSPISDSERAFVTVVGIPTTEAGTMDGVDGPSHPGPAAARFAMVELTSSTVTLTTYRLTKASQDELSVAFVNMVRSATTASEPTEQGDCSPGRRDGRDRWVPGCVRRPRGSACVCTS